MNQEKIMKRKMISAIVLCIITSIALLVFIGLYVDETKRVQETYRKQYKVELNHVIKEADSYIENGGDLDLRYRRIISYMSCAGSYAFLIDEFTEEQVIITQFSTCLIKYPEQMKGKMEDIKTACEDMYADLDKGYDEAEEIINSVDLKGY